MDTKVYYIH